MGDILSSEAKDEQKPSTPHTRAHLIYFWFKSFFYTKLNYLVSFIIFPPPANKTIIFS